MTIEHVENVKKLIEEIGENQIGGIYKYRHVGTGKKVYAVFIKDQYIDIYRSPFCTEIETVFYNGKWEQKLEEE